MTNQLSFSECLTAFHSRLKIAYHYFQEQKEIAKQRDSDGGKIYRQYYSFPLIKKAYFEQSILTLCTLFEKASPVSLFQLRETLGERSCSIPTFDDYFDDFDRIFEGVKTIRDKSIAHLENLNIDQFYVEANITYADIDSLFLALLDYLKALVNTADIQLGYKLTFAYCPDYGIKQIYAKLA
ncbi:hypothetical protein E4T80_02260 [Muribacter muris]|uniref:HEPN AbiU2-like domain-containing protein n=1 Tax=Muribacter muris TaxID=67855 RepID=A0A4Y9K790_9PAST|nr:hypothetical protein [Muribacter muris]MBF0784302.1 hypothetical protein [Muribacter muris]MBF0826961.1 hypothetical protein [Muribacter muris]TFV13039.1 hypothetical protein E4T80_02260 [Muribacter muris]